LPTPRKIASPEATVTTADVRPTVSFGGIEFTQVMDRSGSEVRICPIEKLPFDLI
jgi:hypothetical protein